MRVLRRCFNAFATGVPWAALAAQIAVAASAQAQIAAVAALTPRATSAAAASRIFHDPVYKVSVDYPASWTFTRKDREISTFHLDARSAPRSSRLRAVAAIPENPYPASTFSGAYVYLSVTPHSTSAACARQAMGTRVAQAAGPAADGSPAAIRRSAKPEVAEIAGIAFAHGQDQQKHICITDRDEIYTTYRRGACYRFDLAINNFCGGEVSSVKDITAQELDEVRSRMEAILATVRFDSR
jgi:hypothetical protein